jgi:hypothetical protein
MIQPTLVQEPLEKVDTESIVALFFKDLRPLDGPAAILDWRLDGQMTNLLIGKKVRGQIGEQVVFKSNRKIKSPWILFVGGDKWYGLSVETHASLVRHMVTVAVNAGFEDLFLAFKPFAELDQEILYKQIFVAVNSLESTIHSCRYSFSDNLTV